MLERFITHVAQHPGVWFTSGREVARYWREHHADAHDIAMPGTRLTQGTESGDHVA
jgi:hypothetical protein